MRWFPVAFLILEWVVFLVSAMLTVVICFAVSGTIPSRIHNKEEIEEFAKMSNDFACCVELLYGLLQSSRRLMLSFPLESGKTLNLQYIINGCILSLFTVCISVHLTVFIFSKLIYQCLH